MQLNSLFKLEWLIAPLLLIVVLHLISAASIYSQPITNAQGEREIENAIHDTWILKIKPVNGSKRIVVVSIGIDSTLYSDFKSIVGKKISLSELNAILFAPVSLIDSIGNNCYSCQNENLKGVSTTLENKFFIYSIPDTLILNDLYRLSFVLDNDFSGLSYFGDFFLLEQWNVLKLNPNSKISDLDIFTLNDNKSIELSEVKELNGDHFRPFSQWHLIPKKTGDHKMFLDIEFDDFSLPIIEENFVVVANAYSDKNALNQIVFFISIFTLGIALLFSINYSRRNKGMKFVDLQKIDEIKKLISRGELEKAIELLNNLPLNRNVAIIIIDQSRQYFSSKDKLYKNEITFEEHERNTSKIVKIMLANLLDIQYQLERLIKK